MEVALYQTIENRGDKTAAENYGPIVCNRNEPWLGDGHYFWDTSIENAHWWGKTHYGGYYMIGQSGYLKGDEELFDLIGDMNHRQLFKRAAEQLKRYRGLGQRDITVAYVLEFMKSELTTFRFKACRADGTTLKAHGMNGHTFYFDSDKHYIMNLFHKTQVCVYDKTFLTSPYRIIHVETPQGYVV